MFFRSLDRARVVWDASRPCDDEVDQIFGHCIIFGCVGEEGGEGASRDWWIRERCVGHTDGWRFHRVYGVT